MKYASMLLAGLMFACSGAVDEGDPGIDQTSEALYGPKPDKLLWRGWASGDHFLTTDTREFSAPGVHQDPNNVGQCWSGTDGARYPFYRLYNAAAGDHLYTLNGAERSYALSHGFVSEITPCYIYPTQLYTDMRPLYRLYNNRSQEHLYTPSAAERDSLVNSYGGWVYETVAGYFYANTAF